MLSVIRRLLLFSRVNSNFDRYDTGIRFDIWPPSSLSADVILLCSRALNTSSKTIPSRPLLIRIDRGNHSLFDLNQILSDAAATSNSRETLITFDLMCRNNY
jgi:hypothetical protein